MYKYKQLTTLNKRILFILISIPFLIAAIIGVTFAIIWGSFGRHPKNKIGIIMDDAYYFSIFNKGVYKYVPEESLERVLRASRYSDWIAGEGSIFYIYRNNVFELRGNEMKKIIDLKKNNGKQYALKAVKEEQLIITYNDADDNSGHTLSYNIITGELSVGDAYKSSTERKFINNGHIVARSGDYIYYAEKLAGDTSLYCYDIKDESSWLMNSGIGVNTAVTDGKWFYINTPLQNGVTSCWEIVYDNDGKPYTLKLIDKDIFAD